MTPIKTALCSFGMSGKVFHAPFIHLHAGFKLYGVVERTRKIAEHHYQGVKSFATLEEMLQEKDIELVVVNTPNYTHFDFAKKALQANKNVIVEKPFTLNTKEADELISIAKEKGRKLSVYQNRRWDSDYQTVKDVVTKNLLGKIVEAEFHFDRFKEDISPKKHKEEPGPGTGVLYDLGSHLIDQALQLFGMPEAVFADTTVMRPVAKVEDYMEILLLYSGLRVRLKASYTVKEPLPSYILHGLKGSFIKSRADIQETDLQAGRNLSDKDWGTEPVSEQGLLHTLDKRDYIPTFVGNYMHYYDGIFNALRNNAALPVTAQDGRHVIAIIEAANKSIQEKKIITF